MRLLRPWYFISPWILQRIIWIPTRLLLIICGHIEIKGAENLKHVPANAIFACNHSSEFDVLLLPGGLPFLSRFAPIFYTSRGQGLYKRSGWKQHLYGGFLFNLWGAYAVKSGQQDYAKSLEVNADIVRHGGSLCIFPEGRTTQDGNLQQGRGGVIYLAYATGRPIVPTRLGGTFHLNARDFFLGRRTLSISFGEPMYVTSTVAEALTSDDFKAYANTVMEKIQALPSAPIITQPMPIPVPKAA